MTKTFFPRVAASSDSREGAICLVKRSCYNHISTAARYWLTDLNFIILKCNRFEGQMRRDFQLKPTSSKDFYYAPSKFKHKLSLKLDTKRC